MESWIDNFARANFKRSADTAHDLKTPLNVAVLNLELLRMRLRKIATEDDEKIVGYANAIETELRRLGRIFDAFFLLSTPPGNEGEPGAIDVAAICAEIAGSAGFTVEPAGPAPVVCHEARIRQAFKMFFEGAAKLFPERQGEVASDGSRFSVALSGSPASAEDPELTRIFKFYYTDSEGKADLSLAVARLIAETYGGEVSAALERDKVVLRLSLPMGAR